MVRNTVYQNPALTNQSRVWSGVWWGHLLSLDVSGGQHVSQAQVKRLAPQALIRVWENCPSPAW